MSIWSWMVFSGAILVAIGTFVNEIRKDQDQLKQKDEIITEFKNLITGGDSFLFLRPAKVGGTDEVILLLEFKGKYPLYDVSVTIEEFNLVPVAGRENTFTYVKSGMRTVVLGTVNPLRGKLFEQITIPSNNTGQFGRKFFFSINTRNNLIEEELYLRKEGPHYSQAYKVVTFAPDYETNEHGLEMKRARGRIRHVDSGFPVHQLDHLQGDSGWTTIFEEQTGVGIVLPASSPVENRSPKLGTSIGEKN